jgi:hypothetical protein
MWVPTEQRINASGGLNGGSNAVLQPVLQRFDLTLTDAQAEATPAVQRISGNWLLVADGTTATNKAFVRFNGDGAWVPVYRGFLLAGIQFDKLEFYWAGQTGASLTFIYTSEQPGQRVRIF